MKKKVQFKVCPDCQGHIFKTDYNLFETYCYKCGLVLKAPPSNDFTTPDLKTRYIILTLHEEVTVI